MGRIIKAKVGEHAVEAPPIKSQESGSDNSRIIAREVYQAQLNARKRVRQAEEDAQIQVLAAKKALQNRRKVAIAKSSEASFTQAALDAIDSFKTRANVFAEMERDIRLLGDAMLEKVMGEAPAKANAVLPGAIAKSIDNLRAQRKFVVGLGKTDLSKLEADGTLKKLKKLPEVIVKTEAVANGFVCLRFEFGEVLARSKPVLKALESLGKF